jgi:hypothetical protein
MTHPARPIRERILNTRLVREQTPMRGRELIAYLTLTALIAIPAVFGLWQQNVYVRSRFEIESLRKEMLVLQERYRRLRTEKATLEAAPRIAAEARRIGLVPRDEAKAPSYIEVRPGVSAASPGPPGATISRRAPDARTGAAPAAAQSPAARGDTGTSRAPAGDTPPL